MKMWRSWHGGMMEVAMADDLKDYKKKRDYLVCVDSDGCAMDTMNSKHFHCFGPCMVAEWGLEEWQEEILARWNEINLFTMTRGINRFKGLAKALGEIQERYCEIKDLSVLEKWVQTTPELSNAALERAIGREDNICLRKALAWSEAVNRAIDSLPENEKRPFRGVREALEKAHKNADVAIVSSANRDAVLDEWEKHGLLEHTDLVLAQDSGSKAYCIGELVSRGYAPDHVLMCGDAVGDLEAAEKNGVFYFPILVRHEEESWKEFVTDGLPHLLKGTYGDGYQQEQKDRFVRNLKN